MGKYDAFIDAFLQGDTLFQFVYVPDRHELFLEEELEEKDNGRFLYVPFKDARDLYLLMGEFSRGKSTAIEEQLFNALSSPSPIEKFEKVVVELSLASEWTKVKRAFAEEQIKQWMLHYKLDIE